MANQYLISTTATHNGTSASHRNLIALIVGLVVGFTITQLLMLSTSLRPGWINLIHKVRPQYQAVINSVTEENSIEAEFSKEDFREHTHSFENSSVAQKLYKEVRILCWILTGPKNHERKARHVKRTWGKRCNKLLFMSSEEDKELGAIALNVSEGRNWLWGKTKEAFKYVYEHHFNDYDWFYKADDDTYAIIENMRYLLYPYSTETPIYFGAKFRVMVKPNGYMSGGAGYVLSKEAVRRFVTIGLPKLCSKSHGGAEDLLIGYCLQKLNVTAGDSRDINARSRFFPLQSWFHILSPPGTKSWYWIYIYYQSERRMDRVSDYAISFHYIEPTKLYVLDYLIYHVRTYGIVHLPETLPSKLKVGEVLPSPTMMPNTTKLN